MSIRKIDVKNLIAARTRGFRVGGVPTFVDLRLAMIDKTFHQMGDPGPLIWGLAPVIIVTHLEVNFRTCIEHIIDHGEPFLSRSDDLSRNISFNFHAVKALHGRQLTLGAIIAHALPFSDFSHIDGPLSRLLGEKFRDRLEHVRGRHTFDVSKEKEVSLKENSRIIADVNDAIATLQRMFRIRHIIVHELPNHPPFERSDVSKFFDVTRKFIHATDEIVSNTLYPDAPLTQDEMNRQAHESYEATARNLQELVDKYKEIVGADRSGMLDDVYSAWQEFCGKYARFEADAHKGGSIWPTVYYGELAALQRLLYGHIEPRTEPLNC